MNCAAVTTCLGTKIWPLHDEAALIDSFQKRLVS